MSAIDRMEFGLGRILVTGPNSSYSASVDRAAVDAKSRCTLYFMSAIGPDSSIKGIRAALAGTRTGLSLQFFDLTAINVDMTRRDINRERLALPGCKWKVVHQKLKYGNIHAMFIARDPDFLINVGEESIWQALNHPRFTTPILRHWMPYIIKKLIEFRHLHYIYGHRCKCGLLKLKTEQLDAIVSDGVRLGHLNFIHSHSA